MEFFVEKGSVVRKIWGKGDTILFVFAGSAAEFALNKAVDWLYFTGRLPCRPSREIIFNGSICKTDCFLRKRGGVKNN